MATAFWIADGAYIRWAKKSQESVLAAMPELTTKIFMPGVNLPLRRHEFWYLDSVRYFNIVLYRTTDDRLLYMDADTFMCEPIWDMLDLLDKFDLVGTHAPGRRTTYADVVPAFPEINVGVMAIKVNEETKSLFSSWLNKYIANPDRYGNNDQGPLREALWEWHGRLYVAPPEYNMRWQFGGFARYPVKVLHGRCKDYNAICKKLNETIDMRGWNRGAI